VATDFLVLTSKIRDFNYETLKQKRKTRLTVMLGLRGRSQKICNII